MAIFGKYGALLVLPWLLLCGLANGESSASYVKFLVDIRTLQGDFVQYDANGAESHGKLMIKAPDKMKIEYLKPDKMVFIANEGKFAMYDEATDEVSYLTDNMHLSKIFGNKNLEKFFDISSQGRIIKIYPKQNLGSQLQDIGFVSIEMADNLALPTVATITSFNREKQVIARLHIKNSAINSSISDKNFIFSDKKLHYIE